MIYTVFLVIYDPALLQVVSYKIYTHGLEILKIPPLHVRFLLAPGHK